MNTNSSILDKAIVLCLNAAWMPLGHRTVKSALIALNGGDASNPPAVGVDIAYPRIEGEGWNFDTPLYLNPLKWADWVKLPIRDFDFSISSARLHIRVPTVIIATGFAKMPMKEPKVSRQTVYDRDAGICQFSGEFVGRDGGNLDHVVPRSRGGKSTFENLVWAKKRINTEKADRHLHETGLRLIRVPTAPKKVPVSATLREIKHPDWKHFI